jgi:hypothetical protein
MTRSVRDTSKTAEPMLPIFGSSLVATGRPNANSI